MADFLYGKRVDPYRSFRFRVLDANGKPLGGFAKVSGLKDDTEVIEYREGVDGNTVRKLPGITTCENIVLERGLSADGAMQSWRDEVWKADTDSTMRPDSEFRRDLVIQLLDMRGVVVKEWRVMEAWPATYEIGDMDANASDVVLEHIELANEGHYMVTQAGRLTAGS